MNIIIRQQISPGRLADLSPFEAKEQAEKLTPRGAARTGCDEKGGVSESDSDYGCVDWYLYPHPEATKVASRLN